MTLANQKVEPTHLIIFDGACNFCNGAVNFIIRRDPDALYSFAPMQSEFGRRLLRETGAGEVDLDTFLLIEGAMVKERSEAALSIAENLTQPWPLLRVLRILPPGFRDFFYDLFARNRYKLFGRKEACMVPGDDIRDRFPQSD